MNVSCKGIDPAYLEMIMMDLVWRRMGWCIGHAYREIMQGSYLECGAVLADQDKNEYLISNVLYNVRASSLSRDGVLICEFLDKGD